jgi:ATP-dependent Lhr-like helicase
MVAGRPVLSVHAGGKSLRVLGRPDDVQPALEALTAAVRAGRLRRLVIETIDGEPAVATPLAERLIALGFRRGLHDFALAPGDA